MALSRWHESALAPWAALLASGIAAGLNQQVLADVLRYDCRAGTSATGVFVGVLTLLLVAVGCWASWASIRGQPYQRTSDATRRFVVRLGLLFAALAAVLIAWQVLATFLVPACPD